MRAGDVELPGVPRVRLRRPEDRLTDHDRFAEEPVCVHRTPERPLGGHAYRVGRHWQIGNAEALKVARPSFLVGKSPPLVRRQSLDQRSGHACPCEGGGHVRAGTPGPRR